jgi:ELWxxDGT repeat protein
MDGARGTRVLFNGGFGEDEPFVVDDTPAGGHRLRDINAATGRTLSTNFSTSPGTALGDVLLFNVASDSQLWLWRSDGTADGTFPLLPVSLGVGAAIRGRLAFVGTRYEGGGLWSSDSTPDGTTMLAPLRGNAIAVATDDALYAIDEHPDFAPELWVTDGTPAGTRAVTALAPSASYDTLTPFAGGLAYVTRGFPALQQVWWLPAGATQPFTSARLPISHSSRSWWSRKGRCISPPVARTAFQLWRTDGTVDGAAPMSGVQGGVTLPSLRDITAAPGGVVFAFTGDDFAVTPWFYDGVAQRRLGNLRLPMPGDAFSYEPIALLRSKTRSSLPQTTACTTLPCGAPTAPSRARRWCATSTRADSHASRRRR